MDELFSAIAKLSPLTEDELAEFSNALQLRICKKGETVLHANSINRKLYFINNGLLKVAFLKDDKEFVMKFFATHEFCAVLDSLVTGKPSNYTIVALVDTELVEIDFAELGRLASQSKSFEKIISGISSRATHKMMARIRELLETDAAERYVSFQEQNKHLVNLITLKDLAAYLGISQVSLSRIRAKR